MTDPTLDLICLGRAAVDLYAEQLGARLEDAQSFAKYVGGCAANIAIGTARQGMRVAMLSRVGDEHMGRFVRETMLREGVDVSHLSTDPSRLTGLVLLGLKDRHTFPLIFYRENCSDMALSEADVDREFIASARGLLVTGTHFSQPGVDAASRAAIAHAKAAGTRVILDIDYRPVLWGLTGHGEGEERFVADDDVSAHLQSIVGSCDLVVGTEEEIHIAGGSTDTVVALRALRAKSEAIIVMKRGPLGCVIFHGPIDDDVDRGLVCPGFPVEVMNVLGAGDAFMSGFLRGWLADEPLSVCADFANACGALVVTRHGCAPAMPSRSELDDFLSRATKIARPERDAHLLELHRFAEPRIDWPEVCVLAIDNRLFLEHLADHAGVPRERLHRLKTLLAEGGLAAAEQRDDLPALGVIIDDAWGSDALDQMTGRGWWVARPIEESGKVPLTFLDGRDVGLTLRAWPKEHVIKTLVRYHPNDSAALREEQLIRMEQLFWAASATEHELLLEIIPSSKEVDGNTLARGLEQIYERGIRPAWWKLEAPADVEAWAALSRVILDHDTNCRGVLVLGGGLSRADLSARFTVAAGVGLCRGFAVGRTIFADPSRAWLSGEIDDRTVVAQTAERFLQVIDDWRAREA